MISSVSWVRSGAARSKPVEHEPTGDDMDDETALAGAHARGDGGGASGAGADDDEITREFGLDTYDEDDDPRDAGALPMFSRKVLMYHSTNDDDPYITLKDGDEDEDDVDDLEIRPTDRLILAARSEEDVSNIEVHVYEEDGHNLYPHHDILLPSFPLALEWLGYRPAGTAGSDDATPGRNLVVVGTFEPQIEIWDLDVLNTFTPLAVLGEPYTEPLPPTGGKLGKKKKKKGGSVAAERAGGEPDPAKGHTDAVMALAWNALQPNALASGSADHTVRLWDLSQPSLPCVQTLTHHAGKVQAVRWHPTEPSVLLSGAFDRTAAVLDVRTQGAHRSFALDADVESATWLSDEQVLVSTEDGHVSCFDVRTSSRVWLLAAHDAAATGLSINPQNRAVLATCSMDKVAKVWRIDSHQPALIESRELGLGALFDVAFCADAPHLLAAGGSTGKVGVWNTLDSAAMCELLGRARRETPVGGSIATAGMQTLEADSESDDDDEGDEAGGQRPPNGAGASGSAPSWASGAHAAPPTGGAAVDGGARRKQPVGPGAKASRGPKANAKRGGARAAGRGAGSGRGPQQS